jgi:hypothetical protein
MSRLCCLEVTQIEYSVSILQTITLNIFPSSLQKQYFEDI